MCQRLNQIYTLILLNPYNSPVRQILIMPIFIAIELTEREVKHPPPGHKARNLRSQDWIQIVAFTYYP